MLRRAAEHTDEAVFAAAHAELEDLLPGEGTLGERYEGWRRSTLVPPEHVERVVGAAIGGRGRGRRG